MKNPSDHPIKELRALDDYLAEELARLKEQQATEGLAELQAMIDAIDDIRKTVNHGIEVNTLDSLATQLEDFNEEKTGR